jgi:nicotinate-nucleotide pyrophosphorylase (carboxylating)
MDFDDRLIELIQGALKEDVGDGDHSTLACIPKDARGKAVLKIKQDGILAGMQVAGKIFQYRDPSAKMVSFKKDGDEIKYGETAFEIEALVHRILECERLLLNCMQRMSGIATLTRSYVQKLKGYKTRLLDTRKTTPNFRLLEKEAVRIGGGVNHRFGLYDMIMLKDNHIDFAGGIGNAVNKAHAYVMANKPGLKIEVETRTLDEVRQLISVGKGKVSRIMLDNFNPEQVEEALLIIKVGGSTWKTLRNMREPAWIM